MTVPAQVLAAVRSIPHPRQETPMTAPRPSPTGLSPLLDQLDEARIPNHPETRRGFADLPVTRETVHAAIYHAMPYENHEDDHRFAELAAAAGDAAWLFVRDLLDTQQQLTDAIRAVAELADELDDGAEEALAKYPTPGLFDAPIVRDIRAGAASSSYIADRIRAALAALRGDRG